MHISLELIGLPLDWKGRGLSIPLNMQWASNRIIKFGAPEEKALEQPLFSSAAQIRQMVAFAIDDH